MALIDLLGGSLRKSTPEEVVATYSAALAVFLPASESGTVYVRGAPVRITKHTLQDTTGPTCPEAAVHTMRYQIAHQWPQGLSYYGLLLAGRGVLVEAEATFPVFGKVTFAASNA